MKTYADLTTPRTADEILLDRINALKGAGSVVQTGGRTGLGDGTGSIVLTGTGAIDAACVLRVATGGEPDVATVELSVDGGLSFGLPFVASSVEIPLGTTGLRVTFLAGLDGYPSFVADDVYSFAVSIPVFDATAWQPRSVPRSLTDLEVGAAEDHEQATAAVAQGAYLKDAAGGWVDLHAGDVFDEDRRAAVFAEGQITLSDSGGSGPVTITEGQLWAAPSSSDLRFSNLDGGVLPLNGTLNLRVRAEQAGAGYNVANNSIDSLATPLPGVTVANPSRVGGVTLGRIAAPVVSAALQGTLAGDFDVILRVTTGGVRGVAIFKYTLDGGRTWVTGITTAATVDLGTSGIRTTWATGTYIANDSYTFEASVSWLAQQGADLETDDSLKARCRAKWGTLAVGRPDSAIETWAKAAAREVEKVYVRASPTVPGEVEVWLAGPAGAVTPETILAVEAAIAPYIATCSTLLVQSAATLTISLAGTIYVKGDPSSATATALAALAEHQAATPIGGNLLSGSGIVSRDVLIGCLSGGKNTSRVVDLSLTTPAGDTAVAADEVAVFDVSGLSWVGV